MLAIIGLACGAAPMAADAQVATGEVGGVVVDAGDAELALSGATVRVLELDRGVLVDRAGRFLLSSLPPGTYTIRVERAGYHARETRVTVVPGGAADLVVTLERAVFDIDEIVATATPFGSGVAYQPAQALDRETVLARAATSIGELLGGEPGLAMRSGGPAPARPVIRGLDGDRVLVLENGERMGDLSETSWDHAIAADPLAADRIEVVRGPASLLYGSSALGGVVNILSEDVPRVWSRGASGSVALQGMSGTPGGAGFGRVTFGGERLAFTARASARHAGDLRTPDGVLPSTRLDGATGVAGVGYSGNAFSGGIAFGVVRTDYGVPEHGAAGHDDHEGEEGEEEEPHAESVELSTRRQTLQAQASYRRTGFVDHVELRVSGARYRQEETESGEHGDGDEHGEIPLAWRRTTLASTLTFRHAGAGPVDRGAFGFHVLSQRLGASGSEVLTPDARLASAAAFVFEEIPVGDVVRIQAGGRWEVQRVRAVPNEHFPDADAERTATTFSGALGANIRPAAGLELGFQVGRAHRAPTAEELFKYGPDLGNGTFEVGDPNLKNEIGLGLDAFGRYTGDHIHVEIAGFRNRVDDFIVYQPTGEIDEESGYPIFVHEPARVVLVGAEATFEARLSSLLRLHAGADYVRGERLDEDRTPLPTIPPLRFRLRLQADGARGWLAGGLRWAADQDRVAPNEKPTEGYALIDLSAGYRSGPGGRHLITLRVDNLLDTAWRDHLSRVSSRDNPMPGRSVNIVYRWSF